jgi:peptidoglycan/LPS O-acetylase OafA/YrhL
MEHSLSAERLPPRLSVYIDSLRILASLLVMVSHYPLTIWLLKTLTERNYAYDAVAVFFVLSGYVISYASETFEKSLKSFVTNRAARILPVAISAIVFSLVAFYICTFSKINAFGPTSWLVDWQWTLIQSVTFTNQVWSSNLMPFSNGAYWSLVFEVWCYAFYAAIVYARGWTRVSILVLLAIILGPKQILILPMWLFGSAAYHLRNRFNFEKFVLWLMLVLPVASYFPIRLILSDDWSYAYAGRVVESMVGFGLDGAANFGWGYILSLMVAVHLYAFGKLSSGKEIDPNNFCVRWVRKLSSYTFTLYLFHLPVIKLILSAFAIEAVDFSIYYRVPVYIGMFAIIFMIGNVVEQKKSMYRGWACFAFDFCSHAFRRGLRTS